MGCDIHIMVERKVEGKWELIEVGFSPCTWCKGEGLTKKWIDGELSETEKEVCFWCEGAGLRNTWDDRHYDLFGEIAGVRRPVEPRFPLRGVPDDCCAEWKAEVYEWGCDWHSHTWLTPAEGYEIGIAHHHDYGRPLNESFARFCKDAEAQGEEVRILIAFDN